jgi:uncharacterized membrane protein HdeD (DUF308 family)
MNDTNTGSRGRLYGILIIVLGCLTLGAPLVMGEAAIQASGLLIAIAGLVRIVWALQPDLRGGRVWKLLLGILTVLAGGAVLAHPVMASGILTLALAGYLFTEGLIEVITAMTMPTGSPRGWVFFGGLTSAGLACLLFFQFPLSGVLAIGVYLGLRLVVAGITVFALGTTAHAISREQGSV